MAQHGSFINHMTAKNVSADVPQVGDGCTFIYYTDREPGTVVRVDTSGKRPRVWVKGDKAVRIDGNPGGPQFSECQQYRFEPNPEAGEIEVRYYQSKRHTGWFEYKPWADGGVGTKVVFGYRSKYYDYSF